MLDVNKLSAEINDLIAERLFKDLIIIADQLIEDHPDSYLGRWWKARAFTLMGDTESALHWFIEAIKKADDDYEESKICSSMANVYNIRKEWEQSLNFTEIALELNSENVVAVISRSFTLMTIGKKKEATQLLEKNIRLFKDDYHKACVAAVKKEKEKMLLSLQKALSENPHYKITALYDPDFTHYQRDHDFRALLKA